MPVTFCVYAEMASYVLALGLRPWLARCAFPFSLRAFYLRGVAPSLVVAALAIILPLWITNVMADGWLRFVVSCGVCEVGALLLILSRRWQRYKLKNRRKK